MRADSHYVEELDAIPPTQTIRVLPIDRIKIDGSDKATAPASLVESIRKHGVLQPLLVQHSRDGYRLIAGRKRIAAAAAAGTTTVPVLVHHVDNEEAQRLAAESNPAPESGEETSGARIAMPLAQRSAAELSRSLARIGSCSSLLESSELTQQVLSGIVRVEACRSWCLANALTVLTETVKPKTARTSAKAIGRRVMERCEPERRARHADLEIRASVRDATDVVADADLLVAVLSGLVLAALEGVEQSGDDSSEPVTLSIDVKAANHVVFGVSRRATSDAMRAVTPFANVMRHAAERLASMLGGRALPIDTQDTTGQIELPLASSN